MAKTGEKQKTIVELLAEAGEAELAEVAAQIAAKQGELAEFTAKLTGEIAALETVRKAIEIKVHGKPARKSREAKKDTLADRAAMILEECGPCSLRTLSIKLGGQDESGLRLTLGKYKNRFVKNGEAYEVRK